MVPDSMPLVDHTSYKLRISAGIIIKQEKGRLDVFGLERVKYFGGITVFIALVKCQHYSFVRPVAYRSCVVFAKGVIEIHSSRRTVFTVGLNALSVAVFLCGKCRIICFCSSLVIRGIKQHSQKTTAAVGIRFFT